MRVRQQRWRPSSRFALRRCAELLAVCLILSVIGAAGARGATLSSHRIRVYATYYGWYDNTPPGCAAAYSSCAGGSGTAIDPITFASDTTEFPVGTVLYYPTVRKYFQMGDSCQECSLDWNGHGPDGGPRLYHVDLWLGGEGGNEFAAINCEDALTQAWPSGSPRLTTFLVDPPADLPVSSAPLFDTQTRRCFGGARAPVSLSVYRDVGTGRCLADRSSKLGAPARTHRCERDPAERITYDGAFLIHDRRCLRTRSGQYGSTMTWARCDGDAREQWEINPNGTITWVQYTRCVADWRGRLVLSRCTHAKRTLWRANRAP